MALKFDDFNKKVKDLLTIDYSSSYGQEFKAKQKVASIGATVTTTVTLNPKKEGSVSTPAKVSVKYPKAFGFGVNIDKLEYSPKGDLKLETSLDKSIHKVDGLDLQVKTDLAGTDNIATEATYTGIKDTFLCLETKPFKQDFNFSVSRVQGPATLGLKIGQKNLQAPDLGLRITQSGILAVLMVTGGFKTFDGHAHYKVNDDLDVCLNGKQDKKGISATAGVVYKVNKEITMKVKVDEKGGVDKVVSYSPSKGLTFLLAGKFKDGTPGYGLSVSIE